MTIEPLPSGAGDREPPSRPPTTGTIGPDEMFDAIDAMTPREVAAFVERLTQRFALDKRHRLLRPRPRDGIDHCASCLAEWPCVGAFVRGYDK